MTLLWKDVAFTFVTAEGNDEVSYTSTSNLVDVSAVNFWGKINAIGAPSAGFCFFGIPSNAYNRSVISSPAKVGEFGGIRFSLLLSNGELVKFEALIDQSYNYTSGPTRYFYFSMPRIFVGPHLPLLA